MMVKHLRWETRSAATKRCSITQTQLGHYQLSMSEAEEGAEALMTPELQAEFDEWERMSDETMARLDVEEDLGWA